MIATSPEITITYNPRGAASEVFGLRGPEVLLSGPAGTGKSLGIMEKMHVAALKYPNARLLMLRKTRRSLTESGMVTYWQKVRPDLDRVQWKPSMQQYQYPNGSILAVGGLDRPSKIMSSEWDMIYCQEATELTEQDWEACTIRLRNGKMPYQQLLGDCNPDAPTHWLRQRATNNKTIMLESRHEDNPLLFDANGIITVEGARYIGTLEALTGVRLARYRYGIWAAAEGTVFEGSWDRSRNVIDAYPVPSVWPRYLVIDFGYTHPFVCLWAAIDPDGRIIIYRQIYMTNRLVQDHAISIALASKWYHLLPKTHPRYASAPAKDADPLPREIITDHDIEDYKTLERHLGLYTTLAHKSVSDGLQVVAARLRPAGDGEPRIKIMRNSLWERDEELARAKKPICLEDEPDTYVWKRDASGAKEEPVKESDHALDCLRYLTARFDLQPGGVSYFKSPWR